MDENYLDNLLNEISLDGEINHIIEDELDSQMKSEKRQKQAENTPSQEEVFNFGLNQDISDSNDSFDINFSEEQMDELDDLDNLADLDIGDLDFSDIDFDDIDINKLDSIQDDNFDDILKEFEGDLEIDTFFDAGEKEDILPKQQMKDEAVDLVQETVLETNEDLNEDAFDANKFLDSLLEGPGEGTAPPNPITEFSAETEEETVQYNNEQPEQDIEAMLSEQAEQNESYPLDFGVEESNVSEQINEDDNFKEMLNENSDILEQDDLDDLLSILGMEGDGGSLTAEQPEEETALEQDISLSDDYEELEEEVPINKKKTFTQIVFGDPDEDDELSEEELKAIEEKKAAKKAKKQAAKEARKQKAEEAKQQKALNNSQKQKVTEEKRRVKAEKKAKKKAEEAANAEPEIKLNRPMVFFVFTFFLGGIFVFLVFTSDFNYKQAVEKATDYFARQKYHRAYDEIKGVEVKEKDQELKDRIYTVMYVERLYEAYETNLSVGREEKALDSLLRGVDKYYEHYEEAKELEIVSDIDFAFSQIQNALTNRYGISVEQAVELNKLENWEYVKQISAYASGVISNENESPQDMSDKSVKDTAVDTGMPE